MPFWVVLLLATTNTLCYSDLVDWHDCLLISNKQDCSGLTDSRDYLILALTFPLCLSCET